MTRRSNVSVAVMALLTLAGCSGVKPDAAFQDLRQTVMSRTGQDLQWIQDTATQEKVERAVRGILEKNLTVNAAVEVALLNNRSLQATFEEIGISQADLMQAGFLKNPQFAASFRFPDRPPAAADTEYSLTDNLLDLILLPLRKKMAAQQLEQTKLRVGSEVLRLVTEVKTAFYTVQAGQQLLDQWQVIIEADQAGMEMARSQHEAGTVNQLSLLNQLEIYNQARLEMLQSRAHLAADREKLNRLMGVAGADALWKIGSQLPEIPQEEFVSETLETLALSQRLDLTASSNQVAGMTRALSLRRNTRFLPTEVNVGVDGERQTDRQWMVGPTLQLDLPIFDQGQGEMGRLQSQLRQSQRRMEALTVDIRSQVREANALMNADREAAQLYREVLIPQRTRSAELTMDDYNYMLKGPYDLLEARRHEAETERAYIEAWRDYWIARSELEQAVGGKLPAAAAYRP